MSSFIVFVWFCIFFVLDFLFVAFFKLYSYYLFIACFRFVLRSLYICFWRFVVVVSSIVGGYMHLCVLCCVLCVNVGVFAVVVVCILCIIIFDIILSICWRLWLVYRCISMIVCTKPLSPHATHYTIWFFVRWWKKSKKKKRRKKKKHKTFLHIRY